MNEENENQLTKKERADTRRKEKKARELKNLRNRKLKKVLGIVIVTTAVVGVVYLIINAVERSNASRPGDYHAIQGDEHIAPGEHHDEYSTNPPTSGAHGDPLPWGVYETEVADENAVHNLEHGGIWISYKDIDEQTLEKLKDVAVKNPNSIILTPRKANDAPITVTSWGRLMKQDVLDVEQIEEYIKRNINKSPEPLAR